MTFSKLGVDTKTKELVYLSQSARRQGLYIIGSTGTGKSGLIENLIIQDIAQGLGLCLLDPHGDLTRSVLSRLPSSREEDIILLNPLDTEFPFGLNLYQCDNPTDPLEVQKVVEQVMHIFELLFSEEGQALSLGVRIAEGLENSTYALTENHGMTMAEIPMLFLEEMPRRKLTEHLQNDDVWRYWEEYSRGDNIYKRDRYDPVLNKVRPFLRNPIIRNIVGQSQTTIDFREVLDTSKILLVQLSAQFEGMTKLIGSVIVAQLLHAALSRTDIEIVKKRKQFNVYADEFQRFATRDFATLLVEARKFGIATTIAHQFRNQLKGDNRGASLNVANFVVFRVSSEDAHELKGQFDATPPPAETRKEAVLAPVVRPIEWLLGSRGEQKNPVIDRFVHKRLTVYDDNTKQIRQQHSGNLLTPKYLHIHRELDRILHEVIVEKNPRKIIPLEIFFPFAQFAFNLPHSAYNISHTDFNVSWPYLSHVLLEDIWKDEKARVHLCATVDVENNMLLVERWGEVMRSRSSYTEYNKRFLTDRYEKEVEKLNLHKQTIEKEIEQYTEMARAAFSHLWTGQKGNFIQQIRQSCYSIYVTNGLRIDRQGMEIEVIYELEKEKAALAYYQSRDDLYWRKYQESNYNRKTKQYESVVLFRSEEEGEKRKQESLLPARMRLESAETLRVFILREYQERIGMFNAILEEELASLERVVLELQEFMQALAENPPLAPNGEYEEKPIAAMTYADVANQIANELTNLPDRTAKIRIKSVTDNSPVEHIIKTLELENGLYGKALEERIDGIREKNRQDGYVRERIHVEDEIRIRQDELKNPKRRKSHQGDDEES